MACNTLVLIDEQFGPPIEETAAGATTQRGEWKGITLAQRIGTSGAYAYATTPQQYDIAGVSVTANPPAGSNVLVTIASIGASVALPWRPTIPGATNLTAARFRSPAEFLVIRDNARLAGAIDYAATFYVFDLRAGAATPVQPVVLGPFQGIPAQNEIQFCPSASGLLALIWHGFPSTVTGRRAWVRRTMISSARQADLLSVNDISAGGTLGCEVAAAAGTLTVFDNAYRQGNVAVSRTAGSRNLFSGTIPPPGKLALSLQTLRLTAGQASGSFEIRNAGGDYLEITSITANSTAATVTPGLPLPRCLWPGETLPALIARAGTAAASFTVTVGASPVASPPASGTVSVEFLVQPPVQPRPAIELDREAMSWRVGNTAAQDLNLRNTGNVVVDVVIAASTTGPFTWPAFARVAVPPDRAWRKAATVSFAPTSAAPVSGTLTVDAFLSGTNTAIPGFPRAIALKGNVAAKVPPGSLRIAALMGDAPGDDMLPEGEFIEIENATNAPLDLNGTAILHNRFNTAGRPSGTGRLIAFGPAAFGTDSLLQPATVAGRPLRILTRARNIAAGDPPADRLRVYAGLAGPAWNNTGDTATIVNEFNETVATYTFVSRYPSSGAPALPPNVVVQLPPARRRIMTRRVYVNAQHEATSVFTVQDGDVVTVRNVTGTPHFGGFFGSAGAWGPSGDTANPAPAAGERPDPFGPEVFWPVPGAPKFGLIAQIGNREPFFLGNGGTITITGDGAPMSLTLGVNDCWRSDNNGFFDCVADLYR